ncbi:MAG: hypothetical protein ACKPCP_35675 [Sphaerospermopsis kisseleviana]
MTKEKGCRGSAIAVLKCWGAIAVLGFGGSAIAFWECLGCDRCFADVEKCDRV